MIFIGLGDSTSKLLSIWQTKNKIEETRPNICLWRQAVIGHFEDVNACVAATEVRRDVDAAFFFVVFVFYASMCGTLIAGLKKVPHCKVIWIKTTLTENKSTVLKMKLNNSNYRLV